MPHLLLAIVYLSFLSLGLPDAIVGVAWPAIRTELQVPLASIGLVTLTVTVCSAISSYYAARVADRLGTGAVVAGSCTLTAAALLLLHQVPGFPWMVALAIPLGLGAGAVDATLNHFVASHYSARHMNWLHGCWGVGATIGPYVMGVALAGSGGWRQGALIIGAAQLGLAILLWTQVRLWSLEPGGGATTQAPRVPEHDPAPASYWAPWIAPLCFLLYVSAEMGTGLWAASILVGTRQVTQADAGLWVSVYFGAITAGRFTIGAVANRLGNRRLVRWGIAVACIGAGLFSLPALPAWLSLMGLGLMGLGCAPIFPSLMHETAKRFPEALARTVIARQMMFSYAGVSVVPACFGLLATWAGLGAIMPTVVLLFVALFALVMVLDRLT